MLMGSKLSVKNAKLNITLNSTPLEQVHDVKLLGLNIDENINWKTHIDSLSRTLSSKVGLLHRLSKFIPKSHLISVKFIWQQYNLFLITLSLCGAPATKPT